MPKAGREANKKSNKNRKLKTLLVYKNILTPENPKLMKDDMLTLDEIALMVGYADSVHFSGAFRNEQGVPPGQFRKELPGSI
jgi:AraC-like DNA-binding protein